MLDEKATCWGRFREANAEADDSVRAPKECKLGRLRLVVGDSSSRSPASGCSEPGFTTLGIDADGRETVGQEKEREKEGIPVCSDCIFPLALRELDVRR